MEVLVKTPARRFLDDQERFVSLGGKIDDLRRCLGDFEPEYSTDGQYILMGRWALDRILEAKPKSHVDVGGDVKWLAFLSKFLPVETVDIRDPGVSVGGLSFRRGDITRLPYEDNSIESLSCLHVAEHIGLGRYGDEIDPMGFVKGCSELVRVLKPGGRLYFAVPTGRERVVFNAHRVIGWRTVLSALSGLTVLEFSGVDTQGRYGERLAEHALEGDEYGCGMWVLQK